MKTLKYINPFNPRHLTIFENAAKEIFSEKNKPINVYIAQMTETRTLTQNRYYWSLMQMIADETGDDRNQVHKFMKARFLPSETVELGGFKQDTEATTRELTTKGMTEYIDNIILFAEEFLNITLPRPNEVPIEAYIEAINR
jgi:hypothetical protein